MRGKNTTVVFVPSTRGGLLVRKLKEDRMADITGFRIKFQVAGGSKLINCFDKDLGKGLHCGRTPCPPCDSTDKRQKCRSRNLVYESSCRICNPLSSQQEHYSQLGSSQNKPTDGIYIDETSRSLHERAVEHVRDAESFSAKSHIVKHWMTSHPEQDTPPIMDFKITSMYKDCLSRQIGEALKINFSKDNILNSKGEYLSNCISRLTVEEDAWERRERSRQEEESENLEKAEVEAFMKMKQRGTSHPSLQQEHPSEEPVQSPKTLTASGSCQQTSINMLQEQDNIQVDFQDEVEPEGRGTHHPSIHQKTK